MIVLSAFLGAKLATIINVGGVYDYYLEVAKNAQMPVMWVWQGIPTFTTAMTLMSLENANIGLVITTDS